MKDIPEKGAIFTKRRGDLCNSASYSGRNYQPEKLKKIAEVAEKYGSVLK